MFLFIYHIILQYWHNTTLFPRISLLWVSSVNIKGHDIYIYRWLLARNWGHVVKQLANVFQFNMSSFPFLVLYWTQGPSTLSFMSFLSKYLVYSLSLAFSSCFLKSSNTKFNSICFWFSHIFVWWIVFFPLQ